MQAMPDTLPPADPTLRHRLLASPVRSALLARLRRSDHPMEVRELAASLDLHPNSVREHLDRLVQGGFVRVEAGPHAGRGRPAHRYRSAGTAAAGGDPGDPGDAGDADGSDGYRSLAAILVEEVATADDPVARSTAAGERWGRHLAAPLPHVSGEGEAVERLLELLDKAGFEPETPVARGEPVRLRACPFIALARERRDVVCGIHLGMMQGVLRGLGAPSDDVSLEPFAAPDLCLAYLGGVPRV